MKKVLSVAVAMSMIGCAPSTKVKQKETMTIDKPKGMVALKRRLHGQAR